MLFENVEDADFFWFPFVSVMMMMSLSFFFGAVFFFAVSVAAGFGSLSRGWGWGGCVILGGGGATFLHGICGRCTGGSFQYALHGRCCSGGCGIQTLLTHRHITHGNRLARLRSDRRASGVFPTTFPRIPIKIKIISGRGMARFQKPAGGKDTGDGLFLSICCVL